MAEGVRDASDRVSMTARSRAHPLVWGAVAALCYFLAVVVSHRAGLSVLLPLFDGLAPTTPYRWIVPPPEFRATNEQPLAGAASLTLTPTGSDPLSITTGDGQAAIIIAINVVEPRDGETEVKVTITPRDPGTVAPQSLQRFVNGNAYRFEATYGRSGAPAVFKKPVTVLLRYPIHATDMWRSGESEWTKLAATVFPTTLQLYAETPTLGTFVLTGPPQSRSFWQRLLQQPPSTLMGAAVGMAVLIGYAVLLLLSRRTRGRPPVAR
jgi:hypothetical protein